MRTVWLVLQVLYTLFLLVILAFLGFALLAGPSHDREVYLFIVIGSVLYISLGWFVLKTVPGVFKSRLVDKIKSYKASGFNPRFEVFSPFLHSHYLGVDVIDQKLLFIDMGRDVDRLLNIHDVNSWRIDVPNKSHQSSRITLLTNLPEDPVLTLPIVYELSDTWDANLQMIFGRSMPPSQGQSSAYNF